MNVETFKRISRGALKEVLEEKEIREHHGFIKWWPAEVWPPGVAITELCATLVEGSEEEPTEAEEDAPDVIGEICISTELTEEHAKPEIKNQIRKCLPIYKYC